MLIGVNRNSKSGMKGEPQGVDDAVDSGSMRRGARRRSAPDSPVRRGCLAASAENDTVRGNTGVRSESGVDPVAGTASNGRKAAPAGGLAGAVCTVESAPAVGRGKRP